MPPKAKTPKVPGSGTVDKVRKATDKNDIFSALKIMASRPEYYAEAAPLVKEELEKKDFSALGLTQEEDIIVRTAILNIKDFGYVHPKIGATLRLFTKSAKDAENDE